MDNPADSRWPLEPSKRRAVIVLAKEDIELLRYEPGFGSIWLNEELYFLQLPLSADNAVPRSVASRARRGDVLVQSPYNDDLYEPAATAPMQFAREKLHYVSRLCQLLGARKVSVSELVEHERSDELEVSGELGISVGGYGGGGVKSKYDSSSSVIEDLSRSIADEFDGGSPEIAEAQELLMRTGLAGDPDLRGLLELCSSRGNAIRSSIVEISLLRETRRNVDVLANVNLDVLSAVEVSVELGWKGSVRALSRYNFRIEVDF
jgi:hypothetical protein